LHKQRFGIKQASILSYTFLHIGSNDISYEEFYRISTEANRNWQRLSIHLGISNSEVDRIKSTTKDPIECCFRMLMAWYDMGDCSREKLADTLSSVNMGRIANTLR